MRYFYDDDDADMQDLIQDRKAERRRLAQYCAHPDPRDPDHPESEDEDE